MSNPNEPFPDILSRLTRLEDAVFGGGGPSSGPTAFGAQLAKLEERLNDLRTDAASKSRVDSLERKLSDAIEILAQLRDIISNMRGGEHTRTAGA